MSDSAKKVFDDALNLPESERRDLAQRLLESVGDDESEPDVERAWVEEAKRRLDDVRAGRAELVTWPEAREYIFARD